MTYFKYIKVTHPSGCPQLITTIIKFVLFAFKNILLVFLLHLLFININWTSSYHMLYNFIIIQLTFHCCAQASYYSERLGLQFPRETRADWEFHTYHSTALFYDVFLHRKLNAILKNANLFSHINSKKNSGARCRPTTFCLRSKCQANWLFQFLHSNL